MAGQTPASSPDINPTGNAGALKPQIQTGGSYDAHSGNATRIVNDLRVPGALGVYGLDFTRYWNSTHNDYQDSEMEWPKDFGMSGWSHSWHWSATYDFRYPEVVLASCGEEGNMVCESDNNQFTTAINITFPDGHTTQYKIVRLEHGEWMVPGSYPQFGPPYTPSEIIVWANGGAGVHDHLRMAADGSQFWLTRADGGSVHFVWDATHNLFQAQKVYDPHGLETRLKYYANGYLERVEQDGGRSLEISWKAYSGGAYVIDRVQAGSSPTLAVNYEYTTVDGYLTLLRAVYQNEPLPGGPSDQKIAATYTYGTCYGDGVEPCSGAEKSVLPLLKRADDPHYAGAMTVIRYNYRGEHCPPHLVEPWRWPSYVPAQVWAVKSEKTDSGLIVSSFTIECDSGKRREDNGLGGWRMFYYGGSAGTQESTPYGAALCRGYQLGALTDFTRELALPPNLPTERQNFVISNPYHIWDGRGIMTEAIVYAHDYSGEPSEIRRADGSVDYYNRINPGASEPIDPAQGMHNPYNHWVFSETHQINATTSHTTTYTRDARRRVKRIDYPDGSYEEFGYNTSNQVTSHRLASGATITRVYDGRGLLLEESNSVDLANSPLDYTSYTYYGPGEAPPPLDWTDLVKEMTNGRARAAGHSFSTRMSYNGRQQVTKVEYPDATQTPCANTPPAPTPTPTPTPPMPVAVPEFNPESGIYPGLVTVTISTATAEANIRYTLDGLTPTESHGTLIAGSSGTVAVASSAQGTVLKAVAFKNSWITSGIKSATYSMPQVAAPAISPASGTYVGWFSVTITTATPEADIRFTMDGTTPTESNGTLMSPYMSPYNEIADRITAPKQVKAVAFKSGWATSAVSSVTYSNGSQVANPVFTPASGTYTSDQPVLVTITTATPEAWIRWTWNDETPTESHGYIIPASSGTVAVHSPNALTKINAKAFKTNCYPSAVKFATYSRSKVATPVFNPPAAGISTEPIPVTITTATEQANIRYTLDGTTPTASYGTLIGASSGAITVPGSGPSILLKAIAFKSGWTTSAVKSTQYPTQVNMPTFSPTSGKTPLSVTIATTTAGASIRYTLDGSIPTDSHGTLIPASSGSVSVPSSYVSLKAVAFMSGSVTSPVKSSSMFFR